MNPSWYKDDEADDDGRPSKSSRKREMHALQDIGEELVAMPADRLARMALPDELRAAVMDARRFTKHEARRRQMQYIGRVMRGIDAEPIREAIDAFKNVSRAEVARHHRLERLRADFLEDEKVATRIAETWPGADMQYLRTLRRNALKERELNKPPRSFREMFRVLRELDGASDVADEASDDEIDNEIDNTENS